MAQRIKLENIILQGFSRTEGHELKEITEEYVCEECRHLVGPDDKFCWHCGTELKQSSKVEHWHRGKKLTKEQFKEAKGKEPAELKKYLDAIPDVKPLNIKLD